jgi:hypothetical protein
MWTVHELSWEFHGLRYTEKSGHQCSFRNGITVPDGIRPHKVLGDVKVTDGEPLRTRLPEEPISNVRTSVTLRVFRVSWPIIYRKIGLDELFPEQSENHVHRQSWWSLTQLQLYGTLFEEPWPINQQSLSNRRLKTRGCFWACSIPKNLAWNVLLWMLPLR